MTSAPADPDRFHRHGPVRVSASGTHLAHANGTPFFYLADTAWNGGLLSTDAEWEEYLAHRAAQGFTAIQLITHAPWTAALVDAEGRVAFDERGQPDGAFFDRMDRKLAAINAHGMLAVPVLAWAANFGASSQLNMGHALSADELIPRVRHQVERFGARQVMWILAGDGRYGWWKARKWRRVGRAVFGENRRDRTAGDPAAEAASPINTIVAIHRAPVAMHPMGGHWPYWWFEREGWLDVLGYQSSHSEHPRVLRWLQQGPPAKYWREGRRRPVINLEPVYEGITAGNPTGPFGREAVRRAVWWSLLNAPTAGVTYGAHGVWGWHDRRMESLNHVGLGDGPPWREAMHFAGGADMAHVAKLMSEIEWWKLRPEHSGRRLVLPSLSGAPLSHVATSHAKDGTLAVAYLPGAHGHRAGARIAVRDEMLAPGFTARWFDPRTGAWQPAERRGDQYETPDDGDWIWVARAG